MNKKHFFGAGVVSDPLEAIRRAVYDRHALEACAAQLGKSHSVLSRQLNPDDDQTHLSLLSAAAIEQFLDSDDLAHCFAARRGGIFLKMLPVSGALAELAAGWAKLIHEQAEAAEAFSQALADGKITVAEVDRFEAELRDAAIAGQQLVRAARAQAEQGKPTLPGLKAVG